MSLIIFIAICLLAGYIGSRFTFVSVNTWYRTIKKPAWTPPNWLFAPVWTLLYILMAVAAWRVWEASNVERLGLIIVFAVQLLLNVAWSAIFFGKRNIGLALQEIVLLWLCVLLTMMMFWSVDAWAGVMFVPYLLWVTFAGYLNFTIARLNR